MGYIINDSLAFLHIPKTGGSWTLKVMGGGERFAGQHSADPAPDNFDGLVFTIVRDPLEWLRSFWTFLTIWGHSSSGTRFRGQPPELIDVECWRPGCLFVEFIDRYIEKMPGAVCEMFREYVQHAGVVLQTERLRSGLLDMRYCGGGLADSHELVHRVITAPPLKVADNAVKDRARLPTMLESDVRWAEREYYEGVAW